MSRKFKLISEPKHIKICVLDDEYGIVDTVKTVLKKEGFDVWGTTNINDCLEELQDNQYDIFIVDFLMKDINGDKVIKLVQQFDSSLYIIMLTGHKELAPKLKTIKELQIQGYIVKSDKFDLLIGQVYAGYYEKVKFNLLNHYESFGELIKDKRNSLNLTLDNVSNELNISRQALSNYEKGRVPSLDIIRQLSKYYGVIM
jgi:DNA-binding response OmpR family regulator